jgi:hypothetical protein
VHLIQGGSSSILLRVFPGHGIKYARLFLIHARRENNLTLDSAAYYLGLIESRWTLVPFSSSQIGAYLRPLANLSSEAGRKQRGKFSHLLTRTVRRECLILGAMRVRSVLPKSRLYGTSRRGLVEPICVVPMLVWPWRLRRFRTERRERNREYSRRSSVKVHSSMNMSSPWSRCWTLLFFVFMFVFLLQRPASMIR